MAANAQSEPAASQLRYLLTALAPIILVSLFFSNGLYKIGGMSLRLLFLPVAVGWLRALGVSLLLVLALLVLGHQWGMVKLAPSLYELHAEQLPRVYATGVVSLLITRSIWLVLVAPQAQPRKRILVVGATPAASRFLDGARRDTADGAGIEIVGLLDETSEVMQGGFHGVPWLGGFDRLPAVIQEAGVNVVVMAVPRAMTERVNGLLDRVAIDGVEVHLAVDAEPAALAPQPYAHLGRAATLKLRGLGLSPGEAAIKRVADIVLALGMLVALAPLFLACAIAVKLSSPGPVIFRQVRRGYRGSSFALLKFRSFYDDAADHGASRQTDRNDPRVTPIGAFLRKHSLDELPQLINVLMGHMSIVGPRPHALQMSLEGQRLEAVMPHYDARHRVKPGITGWAQVNGWRGNVDTVAKLDGRIRHDIEYIRNWSLLMDIRILFRTVSCVFHDSTAF